MKYWCMRLLLVFKVHWLALCKASLSGMKIPVFGFGAYVMGHAAKESFPPLR